MHTRTTRLDHFNITTVVAALTSGISQIDDTYQTIQFKACSIVGTITSAATKADTCGSTITVAEYSQEFSEQRSACYRVVTRRRVKSSNQVLQGRTSKTKPTPLFFLARKVRRSDRIRLRFGASKQPQSTFSHFQHGPRSTYRGRFFVRYKQQGRRR